MKVAIVGPGALGCFLAARFALARIDVRLVDHRQDRGLLLQDQGILLRVPEGAMVAVPVPVGLAAGIPPVDLAILTVKAHQTAAAVQDLPRLLHPQGLALTLQNGLGNLEQMAAVLGPERLLAGVSFLGITRLGEGEVLLAGMGPTYIGAPSGSKAGRDRIQEIVQLFHQAGLPCEARDDIGTMLWEKLLVNVGINPLTALLRVRNGVLPSLPSGWETAVAAAAEALAVALAEGYELHLDPETRLREVCRATGANRSSMLQDVLAGRPTEIEALNAQVWARGEKLGVPTPVNRLLTILLRALEEARQAREEGGGPPL
uniref:2-dehydropantoate 2-reductase n=1 Tax=Desulfobacca acetoxidans TaxID=60893 RepID=A0A7C5EM30_9BACT